MTDDFTHLHCHSEMSLLDGASRTAGLVERAVEMGQRALATTDHGNMFGVAQFHRVCSAAGVRPIIGMEAYVSPTEEANTRERVIWGELAEDGRSRGVPGAYTHLTTLATSATGLRTLYRLHHLSYTEGFYTKPRVSRRGLESSPDGLVILSGCAGGELATRLRLGQLGEAQQYAGWLRDAFGPDRAFVEVMSHGIPWERELNAQLTDMAAYAGLPLVATNDSHYTHPGDAAVHDALLCIQTGSKLAQTERFRFSGTGYHLRSRREMESLGFPREALDNTLRIAEMVEGYDDLFDHRLRMPKTEGWLTPVAWEGLFDRLLPDAPWATEDDLPQEYRDRLNYELDIIEKMGYADYFIILADIIGEAKRRGILVGPGRGSAGGCLVAWALRITELDPLAHGLIMERFLNPKRVSLPDIDTDFPDDRRDEMIRYAAERYGADRVSKVITYGTIGAKRALQDAARVLDHPYRLGENMKAALPPPVHGRQPTLADFPYDPVDPAEQEALQLARGLEGLTRNSGIHAAAIIISPEPLAESIPVWQSRDDDFLISGFDGVMMDSLGFVKLDLLGLSNLTTITDTGKWIPDGLPELPTHPDGCTDRGVYDLLSEGSTLGVFQLDSPGMRGLLRRLRPTRLDDIAAVLSLYRPGPMGVDAHTKYADRANGRAQVAFPHRELSGPLAGVLGPTHGLIVFQEQVLQTLNVVCGWDYSDAALLFDAMRKKRTDKMLATRPAFDEAMERNGYSKECRDTLWETLVPFSDYSFAKSHATGYALIAYWTAYLKVHHTAEYMAALLTGVATDPEKQATYLGETRRMGVPILPPDVNDSGLGWSPVNGRLRYGLASIKGVGEKAAAALVRGRPYRGLDDFYRRADPKVLNAGVLGALVKAGALDSLWSARGDLVDGGVALAERALAERGSAAGGQRPLVAAPYRPPPSGPTTNEQRRQWEAETLGTPLSTSTVRVHATQPLNDSQWAYLAGIVNSNPGDQRVVVGYGGWRATVHQEVQLSPNVKKALESIPGVTVTEAE